MTPLKPSRFLKNTGLAFLASFSILTTFMSPEGISYGYNAQFIVTNLPSPLFLNFSGQILYIKIHTGV